MRRFSPGYVVTAALILVLAGALPAVAQWGWGYGQVPFSVPGPVPGQFSYPLQYYNYGFNTPNPYGGAVMGWRPQLPVLGSGGRVWSPYTRQGSQLPSLYDPVVIYQPRGTFQTPSDQVRFYPQQPAPLAPQTQVQAAEAEALAWAQQQAAQRQALKAPALSVKGWSGGKGVKSLDDTKGQVTILVFLTGDCSGTEEVIPRTNRWYATYKAKGLRALGVFVPETSEQDKQEVVKDFVKQYEITYPVALDKDRETFLRYQPPNFPAIYVIDRQGTVRWYWIGAGGYIQTEEALKRLLAERPLAPE